MIPCTWILLCERISCTWILLCGRISCTWILLCERSSILRWCSDWKAPGPMRSILDPVVVKVSAVPVPGSCCVKGSALPKPRSCLVRGSAEPGSCCVRGSVVPVSCCVKGPVSWDDAMTGRPRVRCALSCCWRGQSPPAGWGRPASSHPGSAAGSGSGQGTCQPTRGREANRL